LYKSVPPSAPIRKEFVKCGKYLCRRRKHGPYYFAYWRDENSKLNKKYLGKYEPRDMKSLKLIDLTPIRTSFGGFKKDQFFPSGLHLKKFLCNALLMVKEMICQV
jgi:hypothetical protein